MVCYINIPVKYWLSKNFLKWNIFFKMENTSVCFKNKKDECLSHREVNAFLSLWEIFV